MGKSYIAILAFVISIFAVTMALLLSNVGRPDAKAMQYVQEHCGINDNDIMGTMVMEKIAACIKVKAK